MANSKYVVPWGVANGITELCFGHGMDVQCFVN
uniref:Uncharacterized protein n=1 Tax=Arundo donax TaxID=35708 RepID=A0A0A9B069_ARUDO